MRGLTAPLKEALIQTAARWPFWWRLSRHSSSTTFERMRRSSASNPVFAALGVDEGRRAGSATKPDSSFASEAANDMLSSFSSSSLPPNETELDRLGKIWWEKPICVARARHAGSETTWARFQLYTEILCPSVFSSQVPARKKTGGCGGQSCSLKRKLSASAERWDWCCRSENNQIQWARHLHGIYPNSKRTRCGCHHRAGGTCTNRSNGADFFNGERAGFLDQ